MMSVDEKAREMARQYIPHEGGFSMGGLLQNIIEYFEADVAQLRADRNAAQQRAEQAERERDEARAVIDRAVEILLTPFGPEEEHWQEQISNEHDRVNNLLTAFRKPYYTAPQAQPAWTPQTGAEIAASLEGKPPILPADFDIDRAPTVKADDDRYPILNRMTITPKAADILDPASRYLEYAITAMHDDNTMDAVMHLSDAVGHIIDALKEMQKGGAK